MAAVCDIDENKLYSGGLVEGNLGLVAGKTDLSAFNRYTDMEEMLRAAVQDHGGVQQLTLDPVQITRLMRHFADAVKSFQPEAIVAAVDVRRHVRKLIEQECFDIPVLSPHDLLASVQVHVVHQLDLDDAPMLETAQ